MAALNLFPARVRFVNPDGTLTNEAFRALQIIYERVGGPLGDSGTDTFGEVLGSSGASASGADAFGQVFGIPTDPSGVSSALSDVMQPVNFGTDYYADVTQVAVPALWFPDIQQFAGVDLTGPIAATGGVTTVTSQTGTGTTFVMATSPVLVTPNIGVATGTSFQGIVGNVTPAAGTFTTLVSTGNTTVGDAATDTLAVQAGSEALPSVIPTGDVNTGMWFPSADTIAWSTGGSERARITSAGLALHTLTSAGAATVPLSLKNNSTSAATEVGLDLDPTGNGVGVRSAQVSAVTNGTNQISLKVLLSDAATPREVARFHYGGYLMLNGTVVSSLVNPGSVQVTGNSPFIGERFSADTGGPGVSLTKSRSTTQGSHSIVSVNDTIGDIWFRASDGSAYVPAALIRTSCDNTPGANDMPGRMTFHTTSDGGSSVTERLRIDSTGLVTAAGAISTLGGATFHTTSSALTNGAGVGAGTLLTAPAAGNPTKWIGINDNGTTRYIPAW